MSKLDKIDAMRAMIGLAIMGAAMDHGESGARVTTKDEANRREQSKESIRKAMLLDKGVKSWTIDGITVLARDEKNAIRKVERIKQSI